mmetsp:Transcript_40351/g.67583  ORF Transcript_40351/g.67583 Transcript_40351/m.67583 type:complete len:121 (+) Transcript_40351:2259-2621(+)
MLYHPISIVLERKSQHLKSVFSTILQHCHLSTSVGIFILTTTQCLLFPCISALGEDGERARKKMNRLDEHPEYARKPSPQSNPHLFSCPRPLPRKSHRLHFSSYHQEKPPIECSSSRPES